MENDLEAELDDELGYSKYDYKNKNTSYSRNGHSSKTLCASFGDMEVSVPRDRKWEFEPQVLKKNQISIRQDIEEKILSMCAKGMTTGILKRIFRIFTASPYQTALSVGSPIKVLPITREWQQRPLKSIYAVFFLDAIHYHVLSKGQIVKMVISGDDRHHPKTDWTTAGLNPQSRSVVRIFCPAYTEVTPSGLDVEGKINGFSALDILLRRRYVIE